MNFIDFVINQKLEYAMKKLLTTDLTVDSISKLVGYSNTQYFISKFKSKYGKTPNRFRLNIREIKLQDTEA
jgi:AraC-like DNA-binding protein